MKKLLTILLIFSLLGGAVALLMSNKRKQQEQISAAQKPLPATVQVQPVEVRTFTEAAGYVGKTESWREITMNAITQGVIRTLTPRLNDAVKEGQTVLTVDTEQLDISARQLDAQLNKARRDLARFESLNRENNLPATDLENSRLQVQSLETQLAALAKQRRDAAGKAPVSGIVTVKFVEPGMFIAPGSPLLTITDVSALKLVVNVPEAEVPMFRTGRPVSVRFDMYPERTISGTVHQVRLKGGETGTFPVEIRVVNVADTPLRVGMTAHVSLTGAARASGPAIPRTALVTTSAIPAVYVVQNNKIALRPIVPGATVGTTLIVREGLQPGESVVVSGTEGLKDGMTVTVSR